MMLHESAIKIKQTHAVCLMHVGHLLIECAVSCWVGNQNELRLMLYKVLQLKSFLRDLKPNINC